MVFDLLTDACFIVRDHNGRRFVERLSSSLSEDRQERARLQTERSEALNAIQTAEGQILAIGELLTRYSLLAARYDSDLQRLDFVSEGSYFFEQLQEARCPLCDQPMDEQHIGHVSGTARAKAVYSSAKAEAAKNQWSQEGPRGGHC
jgi:DNA repair exonuclease SbcCD ATPase subunit